MFTLDVYSIVSQLSMFLVSIFSTKIPIHHSLATEIIEMCTSSDNTFIVHVGTEVREPLGLSSGTLLAHKGLEEQENWSQPVLASQGRAGQC